MALASPDKNHCVAFTYLSLAERFSFHISILLLVVLEITNDVFSLL